MPTFQSSPTSITFHRTLYLCLLHHCFSLGLPSLPYGCYHRIWGMHVSGLCQVRACLPLELSQIRYPVFVSSHALKNDPSPLPFIAREVPHLHWNRVMDFPTTQTRSSTINDEWHRSDVVWTERYSTQTYNKDLLVRLYEEERCMGTPETLPRQNLAEHIRNGTRTQTRIFIRLYEEERCMGKLEMLPHHKMVGDSTRRGIRTQTRMPVRLYEEGGEVDGHALNTPSSQGGRMHNKKGTGTQTRMPVRVYEEERCMCTPEMLHRHNTAGRTTKRGCENTREETPQHTP